MPALTPRQILRGIAAEFKDVPDAVVDVWLSMTEPLVSKRKFGRIWDQALALLTAHRMKLSGVGLDPANDPLSEVNGIGVGGLMRVANYSEGEVSIGFNHNLTQYTEDDAELGLTVYGIQYLTLRRMKIMPITSAAMPR
jgi:hypothetical protein